MSKQPPCNYCNGACCRQTWNHAYAVVLDEDELEGLDYVVYNDPDPCFPEDAQISVLPYVDGKCIYLDQDNKCSVYDHRPKRCREFSCLSGYDFSTGRTNSFFLEDNPDVVKLIELRVINSHGS